MSLCLLAYPCQGGGLEICLYVTNWYRIQLSKKYDECNTIMCLFFVTFHKQWCCKHNCVKGGFSEVQIYADEIEWLCLQTMCPLIADTYCVGTETWQHWIWNIAAQMSWQTASKSHLCASKRVQRVRFCWYFRLPLWYHQFLLNCYHQHSELHQFSVLNITDLVVKNRYFTVWLTVNPPPP